MSPRPSTTAATRSQNRGFGTQGEVIWALIMRETRTRFGKNQLGYMWALLEPTIVIFTFWGFYKISHRSTDDMALFPFIATGLMPYTLFNNCVNHVAESINGNKGLLFYPQVRPIDVVIARWLLETATYFFVFILLLGGYVLISQDASIDSPLTVIAGLLLSSMLGSGLGLIFCGLGELSSVAERARGPILRPLFWVSGVFFTANSLPDNVRDGMLTNPILHCAEMVRDGWFESYDDSHVSVPYVLVWIGFLILIGLILERIVRRRIELT